jgi:hypothetical protein
VIRPALHGNTHESADQGVRRVEIEAMIGHDSTQ